MDSSDSVALLPSDDPQNNESLRLRYEENPTAKNLIATQIK